MKVIDTLEKASSQLNYDFSDGISEISAGISESGSVAKMANIDLAQYSSILGVLVEQTGQSGSTVSNAMKTIISRITSASKGMGTLDEDISNAEKSFDAIGIAIRKNDGEFRDFGDIMSDVSEKWDTMNDVQKSNLSFYAAGTRQVNIIKSLVTSWDKVQDVTEEVNNGSGTALENQDNYAKSLQGHLGELEATAQSMWNNLLNSDTLKNGVDLLNGLLSVIDKITSAVGGLGTIGIVGGGVGIASFIQNLD
jgi:TP901 family phage tail tape measure protein